MAASDQTNESIIAALRDALAALALRLTPDIEPATVFSLEPKASE